MKVTELKSEFAARDKLTTGPKPWLRRRLHAAIVYARGMVGLRSARRRSYRRAACARWKTHLRGKAYAMCFLQGVGFIKGS
eukprot:6437620-Prymnesium_polylepis.1